MATTRAPRQQSVRRVGTAPLNTFPLWRYATILVVLVVGVIYAAPNLYPPDYAIQIRTETPSIADIKIVKTLVVDALESLDIPYLGLTTEPAGLLIRFSSNASQLRAQALIERTLAQAGRSDVVALNLAPTTPDWLDRMGGQPMKYGLDLSGGVHFLLEVDIEKAKAERLDQAVDIVKSKLRQAGIRYRAVRGLPDEVWAIFNRADKRDAASELLSGDMPDYVTSIKDEEDAPGLSLQFRAGALKELEDYAISQNLQSLRNRVNELGVSEPLVQRLGRNRIVLDLPGIQDSAKAKEIIGKVANLEFHLEARPNESTVNVETHEYENNIARLERRVIVTGDLVTNAQTGFDAETSLPQVNITLDGQGGDLMHDATRNNVGRRMGVIFREIKTRTQFETDEAGVQTSRLVPYETKRVINLATIQSPLGNRFRITGLSQGEANDLALLLRAGALAAPMYIVEERTVGASLGQENIDSGVRAVVVGMTLVLIFMVVYFRLFGLAANIALTVNLMLLIALMSILGATLTLPGIAGIVLTVGMAVDANVLIFSRIREELADQPPQSAIHMGFERAFVTILDANLTTFIVAIILYAVGTGPIKGFAVTLSIGILTSMFTAIWVTRAVVSLMYGHRTVQKLAI